MLPDLIKYVVFGLISVLFISCAIFLYRHKSQSKIDPQTQTGFIIALVCWSTVPLFTLFYDRLTQFPTLLIIWNLTIWIAMISSICIATMKLFDFSEKSSRDPSSHTTAWKTLALATLFVFAMSLFLFDGDSHFLRRIFGEKIEENTEDDFSVKAYTENYLSEYFHFSYVGSGSTWRRWDELYAHFRYAEFGLKHDDSAYYMVIPFYFEDGVPDSEVFVSAAAPLLSLQPKEPWQGTWERHQQNGFEGYVFDFETKVQESTLTYKMKVLSNDKLAYVVAAWSDHQNPQHRESLLNNIHNRTRFTFDRAQSSLPKIDELGDSIQRRHGKIFENIGHEYLKEGDFEKSIDYLQDAYDLHGVDASVLGSIIFAYLNQLKFQAAKEYLNKYIERYPESTNLYEMLDELSSHPEAREPVGEVPPEVVNELVHAFGELPVFEYGRPEFSEFNTSDYAENRYDLPEIRKRAKRTVKKRRSKFQPQLTSTNPQEERKALEELGIINQELITEVTYDPNQPFITKQSQRMEITNHDGALSLQFLYFPFEQGEKVRVRKVAILDSANIQVAEVSPKAFYVVDGAGEHEGKRVVTVPLPDLKVGTRIQTEAIWESESTVEELDYYEYGFSTKYITDHHQFIYSGNQDSVLHKSTRDLELKDVGNQLTWTFHPKSEDVVATQVTARIWLGDKNKSWHEEGLKAEQSLSTFLKDHHELVSMSRRMTKAIQKVEDKVNILADYVKQTLEYNDEPISPDHLLIPEDYYDFASEDANDSLFHSLYLQKMLAGISVHSHIALIRQVGVLQKDIPSLTQFDYALLYIPSIQNGIFMNLSDKELRPGEIATKNQGQETLILDPQKPYFGRLRTL